MRTKRVVYLAAGLFPLGLLASACSGGSPPGVATLSANAATTTTAAGGSGASTGGGKSKSGDALRFSQCMRAHGVTNFPDPGSRGAISISGGPGSGLDPSSPTFQAAQQACQGLLPRPSAADQQKAQQNALRFSQCMRSHGVTNFPDPQFSNTGGIGIKISGGGGQGLDPNSPTFQAAQQACGKLLDLPNGGSGPKMTTGNGGSTSGGGPSSSSGQVVFGA